MNTALLKKNQKKELYGNEKKYKGNKEYLFFNILCSFKGSYSFDNNTNDGSLFGYMLIRRFTMTKKYRNVQKSILILENIFL